MKDPSGASLPIGSRIFVAAVTLCGGAVVAHSVALLVQQPAPSAWLLFAVLTIGSGMLSLKVPSIETRFSVSEAFAFASVLLFVVNACVFGLFAGAIVVSAGGAVGWAIAVGVLVGLGLIAGLFWYSGAGFRGAWRRYEPRRQTPPGPPPYWRS